MDSMTIHRGSPSLTGSSVRIQLHRKAAMFVLSLPPSPSSHYAILHLAFSPLASSHGSTTRIGRKKQGSCSGVFAAADQGEQEKGWRRQRAPPGVDTRIHWENEDEGWIGGSTSGKKGGIDNEDDQRNLHGDRFTDLLNDSSDSHYKFLGILAEADLEEIKAAYRRLSKEYHPDTTTLPLKVASDKFLKLREVYDVLSNVESRRFYDWTLAQEAASRQAEKMRVRLQDPYDQDFLNYKSVPDMVDRLGGKNMELSDQAMTALTVDAAIIVFAICCLIYVLIFKEPYY